MSPIQLFQNLALTLTSPMMIQNFVYSDCIIIVSLSLPLLWYFPLPLLRCLSQLLIIAFSSTTSTLCRPHLLISYFLQHTSNYLTCLPSHPVFDCCCLMVFSLPSFCICHSFAAATVILVVVRVIAAHFHLSNILLWAALPVAAEEREQWVREAKESRRGDSLFVAFRAVNDQ